MITLDWRILWLYNHFVEPEIAQKILDINRQFYQTFALQFSKTRQRIQPGVRKILSRLPFEGIILDIGCGNGELAKELKIRGQSGLYVGLDFSSELIHIAAAKLTKEGDSISSVFRTVFLLTDLTHEDWDSALASELHSSNEIPKLEFDFIFAFAVFHHIPEENIRRRLLGKINSILKPSGEFIHSEWQFLNSTRLRERIQPWQKVGLNPADLDENDYLLDWRSGGSGLRYVHLFSQEELADLAHQTGFSVQQSFYSDGESGDLSLYQVWKKMIKPDAK